MTVESVLVYLGMVLAGCVVVSIADSFAPAEIATRLEIAQAKGIFTQDLILRGGKTLPLYQRVVDANAPKAIVLPAGKDLALPLREQDLSWTAFLEGAQEGPFPTPISGAEGLTNILFSSGTTGTPKAIGWTHLTPIKAAADGWAHHDIQAGHVVAWPTNLGWMMGPWLIYASLLNGAAIALYEGIPSGRGFCRFVQDAGVTMLGVVPSLVRAWRASDATAGLDWSAIRCFSSTGEASNPEEMHWLMSRAGYKPVIEYCGGTEIGGGYICGTRVQAQAAATFSTPALGVDFLLLNDAGEPCQNGELALLPPMLGSSQRLLKQDHHKVYYEGMPTGPHGEQLRRHGDQMEALPGGFYRALGRVDDTMNLGGIKVSSAEIERACTMDDLKECAAIAVPPAGGGPSMLVVYAVLEEGVHCEEEALAAHMQKQIRAQLNPLFKVHAVRCIDSLPRTASNKVMRRVLRAQFSHG
jgi:acetyl-CoA synthetase